MSWVTPRHNIPTLIERKNSAKMKEKFGMWTGPEYDANAISTFHLEDEFESGRETSKTCIPSDLPIFKCFPLFMTILIRLIIF